MKKIYMFYLKYFRPEKYLKKRGATIGNNLKVVGPINVSEGKMLKIGHNCNLSTNISFYTHDGSNTVAEHLGKSEPGSRVYGPIILGNNVFVGGNSIFLPGVEIGNNVIVGAGSVVTKSFPSNVVIAGNPARIICSFEDHLKKNLNRYMSKKEFENISWQNRELLK